jgi:hypothetical protein
MSMKSKVALIFAALIAPTLIGWSPAASAERMTTISREAFVCNSWAAWREYGQASLTARGAQLSKACPLRLAARTRVTVVEEDAEAGASVIRYRGKTWFIDNQRLK